MRQVQTFNEFLDGFLDEFTVADCHDSLINFTPDEVRFLGLFTGRFVCGLLQMRRLVRRQDQINSIGIRAGGGGGGAGHAPATADLADTGRPSVREPSEEEEDGDDQQNYSRKGRPRTKATTRRKQDH